MPRSNNATIVLTRDTAGNAAWGTRLKKLGFAVYSLPTIETAPLELTAEDKAAIRQLPEFDWIIFTSAPAVHYLHAALTQLRVHWPTNGPNIAAIGAQTAHQLKLVGASVDFLPSQATTAALGSELSPVQATSILLPRSAIAPDTLPAHLTNRGGQVTILPIYTTRTLNTPDPTFIQKIQTDSPYLIVFASPSAVRSFCQQLADTGLLGHIMAMPVVSIGPSTETALQRAGFQQIHTSQSASLDGITTVLQQLLR